MKISFFLVVALCLSLLLSACGNNEGALESETEVQINSSSSSVSSSSNSSSSTSPSGSSPADSSSSRSEESSKEQPSSSIASSDASQSQSSSISSIPEVPKTPTIKSGKFYENTQGSSLSLLCTDYMRFGLSHEDAKKYISGIDFSNLTPSTKQYSIGIDDDISGGAVIMTSSDFSHQLRLDKKNGVAVYSENGSLYYYIITADFYSSVYNRTADYSKYDFNGNPNEGIENEENPDVVTG